MANTPNDIEVKNIPLLGSIATNDTIVGERTPGTTVRFTYNSSANGFINPGTAGQLAYYGANGNTVSGLTTLNSAALLANSSGVLTWTAYTGTGLPVLNTSPTFVTPILGTPTSGNIGNCTGAPALTLTSCTGLPIAGITGLGTGVGAALASAVTGTGNLAMSTSPSFTTPILGTPTSGNLGNCTGSPALTLTNATGLPIAGITGLGTGVGTFLATPSSANLLSALTTKTGTGSAVFGTSPTINTPNIVGVTNASNASAGSVGEVLSNSTVTGAITSNTFTNVTSLSLTAGDWDVFGALVTGPAGTTTISFVSLCLNTVSATATYPESILPYSVAAGQVVGVVAPTMRINVSSTTTVYLVGYITYGVSTLTTNAYIYARRAR